MITVEIENSSVRKSIKTLTKEHEHKLKSALQIAGDALRKKILIELYVPPPEKERII